MSFDSFYKGVKIINQTRARDKKLSHAEINWDEPYAIDFKTAHKCFKKLAIGEKAMVPVYDFVTSLRLKLRYCYKSFRLEKPVLVKPKPILLIEGIFGLYDANIRSLYDLKLFVHADADTRLCRRSFLLHLFFI